MIKAVLLLIISLFNFTACTLGTQVVSPTNNHPEEQSTSTVQIRKATSTQAAPIEISINTLKNLEYPLEYASGGHAKLMDGEFREPVAPGSASKTIIRLSDSIAFGEMGGEPAAGIILVSDPGGSGTFYDLALVVLRGEDPTVIGTAFLGDRIVVNSIEIVDDKIKVDMITQSPEDAMSSPTLNVVNVYSMVDNLRLEQVESETVQAHPPGTESSPRLAGSAWQWVSFTDPLESFDVMDPENYSVEFSQDGSVNIKADCNQASGSYTIEDSQISIEIGPMTFAACPPGSLGDQFVQNLGFVRIYFFQEDHLFLDMMADGGTMKLEKAAGNPQEEGAGL